MPQFADELYDGERSADEPPLVSLMRRCRFRSNHERGRRDPLHIKEQFVGKCDMAVLNKVIMAATDFDVRLQTLWAFYYGQLMLTPSSSVAAPLEEADATPAEKKTLMASKLLARVAPGEQVGGGLHLYSLPEEQKRRRRIIRHTHVVNDLQRIPRPLRVRLPTVAAQIKAAAGKGGASCFDIEGFYDALLLPREVQRAFGLLIDGERWALQTLPTGLRHSVALAQIIALFITRGVPHVDVYIDNVRVRNEGTLEDFEAAVSLIYARAQELGLAFDSSLQEALIPRTVYEFLGVKYDHARGVVMLAQKSAAKLQEIVHELKTQYEAVSVDRAAQIFGVLCWAMHVMLPVPDRNCAYMALKNMRRLARQYRVASRSVLRGTTRVLWPSAKPDWVALAEKLVDPALARSMQDPPMTQKLYTDACLSGWGAVLFSDSGVRVAAGAFPPWLQTPDINELEIAAIANALHVFDLRDTMLDIVVDNTTALSALRKGLPVNFAHNRALRSLALGLSARDVRVRRAAWIRSGDNPADWLSRLQNNNTSDYLRLTGLSA